MSRVLIAVVALLLIAGCGDGERDTERRIIHLDVADAPRLFEEDIRRSFEGSYFVDYDVHFEVDGREYDCTVAWWKDGTERQRFDMCAPLVYGDDSDAEPWRVLMFGDREQILVCSSRLPLDPLGELDEDDAGACHEDPTGIGDLAGNAVLFLGFPLEYPDALPPDYFDGLEDTDIFRDVREEEVAGQTARCYDVVEPDVEDPEESTLCFAENGAELLRSDDVYIEYDRRASEVGTVEDSDFDLPYPYVDADLD